MKKLLLTTVAAGLIAGAMSLSAFADAQTLTSENGIVTVTFPSENWAEVTDPTTCALFTNGADMLSFNHYELGKENLPAPQLSAGVVRIFSTVTVDNKYCYVVTGYCTDNDKEKLQELKNIVLSAQVNEDKMHSDVHKLNASAIAVEDMNQTMYVNADELNVRSAGSQNDAPIAKLTFGDAVTVVGKVTEDGVDTGWVKIDLNGVTGYVMSMYLSDQKPAGAPEETATDTQTEATADAQTDGVYKTGNYKVLNSSYYTGRMVYEYSDGTWRDDYGNIFTLTNSGYWATPGDDGLYLDEDPSLPYYDYNGNKVEIYKDRYTGQKYDADGNIYWADEWGLTGSDGSHMAMYYDKPKIDPESGYYLTNEDGEDIYVYNTDWPNVKYDENGNIINWHEADNTFTDADGNSYYYNY